MENNLTALPSVEANESECDANTTKTQIQQNSISSGEGVNKSQLSITRILEILTLIGGVIALIVFIVGIIITQHDISNNISNLEKSTTTSIVNLQKDVNDYQADNILIKTQIENWFNKIDDKIEDIKDKKEK